MTDQHNDPQPIAVLGGGLAGLAAARAIAEAGRPVAVYDKGRGVSGRCSTRYVDDRRFDHGAQYFTASQPAFSEQTQKWVEAGVAAEWFGELATIECEVDGCRRVDPPGQRRRYVGTPGMNALAKSLAEDVVAAGGAVTAGVRVAPLKRTGGVWRLTSEAGEPLGDFGRVLVTAPAPQASELLTASPALSNAAKSVRVTGCWAAMVAFSERLGFDADGLFVNGSADASPLSWIARNGSKPGRPAEAEVGDCWVLHGSPAWSEANTEIGPEAAAEALLAGFWTAIDVPSREPAYLAAHLWRYALPENPLVNRSLSDSALGLYAAGDWCGGPKIEGAFLSGLAAAEAILADSGA